MKFPKYPLMLCLLGLAGCQTSPPTVFVREVPVRVTSTNYLDVIRFPSTYKSYTIGRRRDPRNPEVMHEAHILYVRESPDRWNLQPPPANATGQPGTDNVDPSFAPLPMDEQLRHEVQKQQQISQSLAEQTERFQQAADVLVPAARKAVELATQIQLRQQQVEDRLRLLEEFERPASFTNWPGNNLTNH